MTVLIWTHVGRDVLTTDTDVGRYEIRRAHLKRTTQQIIDGLSFADGKAVH